MDNRHGLCVLFEVHPAVGAPESEVAVRQIAELQQRGFTPRTVGADRGYCSRGFVEGLRAQGVIPHPAPLPERTPAVKVRSQAHYLSQRARRRIEEIFGWTKTRAASARAATGECNAPTPPPSTSWPPAT